ncbi:MAG: twin-arginine translocation signal domain-containing protein [Chloroflexi bacterium]|nr:twin-arginine translocation signal domain-containing protein [Chloroflexota bacterium]
MAKSYSRRGFLRAAAVGAAGAVLAACQPAVVEKVVKETVVVEVEKAAPPGKKQVRILASSWAIAEVPFDVTAREYNTMQEDAEIILQTTFEGWDTKVIAQINDGTLQWSAAGILTPFLVMKTWTATGMIQPMDTFINSSSQAGADQVLTDMIPTIKEDGSFEGEFYSLAYSFENITFNWRVDYFNAVGATEAPATWDEWLRIALELKKWGADEQIYPTAFAGALWTDVGALICSAMEQPYTAEGLIAWESPEMIEALAFYKKLIAEEELTPPHGSDGWLDAYYSGKVASVQAQSSRGVWGQNAFGSDKVATSPIPTREPGGGVGSVYWGNGFAILNKAPFPQEATDYLVYTMGPQNTWFQKAVIKSGKTPIYNSAYENIIKTDPQMGIYRWMVGMLDDVNRSVPAPRNNYYTIQNTMFQKHRVTFTEVGSTMTPEECAQLILKDTQDEIAKQKL